MSRIPGQPSAAGGWRPPAPSAAALLELGPTPERAAPPNGALQIFPGWLYPPAGAVDFTALATGTLAAGAGQTLVITDLVFTQPEGYAGVLRAFTLFVDAPTTSLNVTWTLRVNEAPVPGWIFKSFPRAATNLSIEKTGVVRTPPGAKLDVLITNNSAAGPWTVGAEFTGWCWPHSDELRRTGGA